MTLEIALALTVLALLATLSAITFWLLRRLLAMVFAHLERPGSAHPPDAPDTTMSPIRVPDPWAVRPGDERTDDDDSGHTLLPFSTPLPPLPRPSVVEYTEDEDDVPTTLYHTDDDGEVAVHAEIED